MHKEIKENKRKEIHLGEMTQLLLPAQPVKCNDVTD